MHILIHTHFHICMYTHAHLYTHSYLYWTDWSDFSPRILKTSMDGANSTVLANSTWVTWPNALAIDYTNQVLYWGDAQRDVIGRMNTDGSGIEIITNLMQTLRSNSQPWAISYYDGHIYWSDWLNGRTAYVLKMDISAGNTGSILPVIRLSEVGESNAHPTGVQVVDASRQSSKLILSAVCSLGLASFSYPPPPFSHLHIHTQSHIHTLSMSHSTHIHTLAHPPCILPQLFLTLAVTTMEVAATFVFSVLPLTQDLCVSVLMTFHLYSMKMEDIVVNYC